MNPDEKQGSLPHWNICDACAKERKGAPPSWAVTCTKGTCKYCGTENVTLTPVCDYRWPNGREPIWD